jgi:hypothetical protein
MYYVCVKASLKGLYVDKRHIPRKLDTQYQGSDSARVDFLS